jgi:hypothetical protein
VKIDSNYDYKLRSVWETGAVTYLETHSSLFYGRCRDRNEDIGNCSQCLVGGSNRGHSEHKVELMIITHLGNVTPCSLADWYQSFWGISCLHPQGSVSCARKISADVRKGPVKSLWVNYWKPVPCICTFYHPATYFQVFPYTWLHGVAFWMTAALSKPEKATREGELRTVRCLIFISTVWWIIDHDLCVSLTFTSSFESYKECCLACDRELYSRSWDGWQLHVE